MLLRPSTHGLRLTQVTEDNFCYLKSADWRWEQYLQNTFIVTPNLVFDYQFSRSVVSDSFWHHGLQHARLPCPSPTPGALLKLISVESVMPFQLSHLLSSPSPPAFNLSQHQGLFYWVSSSNQVANVLEFQLQHQSFQRIFRTDFL